MKRYTEFLNKRIIELKNELEQDLNLTQINIKEKSLKRAGLNSKWLMIFFEEEKLLNKLKELKELKIEQFINKENNKTPMTLRKINANKDDAIIKIDKKIIDQSEVVRFCDGCLKIIQGFGFDIKNSIDLIKIEENG